MRGLEHLSYRKGWGSSPCLAWRRKGWEGTSEIPLNICSVGVGRMGPDSFHWCPATGQGAMGTNWSSWTWGRTSSLWGWGSTGPCCPERLWSLFLWRYSKPAWMQFCAACSRRPCFGRVAGLDDPQRFLWTPTLLWFCEEAGVKSTYFNVEIELFFTISGSL